MSSEFKIFSVPILFCVICQTKLWKTTCILSEWGPGEQFSIIKVVHIYCAMEGLKIGGLGSGPLLKMGIFQNWPTCKNKGVLELKITKKPHKFLWKGWSLGAAMAKNGGGGAFPWPTRTIPIWEYPSPGAGVGLAGNIKGFSAHTHLKMALFFFFMPPLQCKSRL